MAAAVEAFSSLEVGPGAPPPEGEHAGLPALPADVLHRIFGQLDW